MIWLLDVNALLALGHALHAEHQRVERWVSKLPRTDAIATCAITELGFVRVAPQSRLSPSVARAQELLVLLKRTGARARRPAFVFLEDALGAEALPGWVASPAQTTDGHLLALAQSHGAELVTLDTGIPQAIFIAQK